MIRLNLTATPQWLDLAPGLRLLVGSLTTALMVSAWADMAIESLPETASAEELALAMAKAVARRAILEWEGVGNEDGNSVPVSPEGINAPLEHVSLIAIQDSQVARSVIPCLEADMGVKYGQAASYRASAAGCGSCGGWEHASLDGGAVQGVGQVRQRHGQAEGGDWGSWAESTGQRRRVWQVVRLAGLGRPLDRREAGSDSRRSGRRDCRDAWDASASRLSLAAVARPRADA